jgi:hypothetical protein
MGAMQAQDYYSSLLAIGLRTGFKTVNEKVIEEASLIIFYSKR